ncbi:MAG: hypothetical protein FP824_07780 [Euryarchaeota archaeon]|nr:hypothetical protein [Euryarchaeota archaeon]
MKCVNCQDETTNDKILCFNCMGVDPHLHFVKAHICQTYQQMKGAEEGVCHRVFDCTPIKLALQNKSLIKPHQGHIVCPHPRQNLGMIIYGKYNIRVLKTNYRECFDD